MFISGATAYGRSLPLANVRLPASVQPEANTVWWQYFRL